MAVGAMAGTGGNQALECIEPRVMSNFYRAFEEQFRGSRALIKTRLEFYRPFVDTMLTQYPGGAAIDLGCGRGEWLELLTAWGVQALGVDQDAEMLAACHELGLKAEQHDALDFLRSVPAQTQMLVSAFHVAEHLPFKDLLDLIGESLRVLKPGGILIIETPNPDNLVVATRTFYLDPTHQRPLPSELLAFAVEHAGFARAKTIGLQEPSKLDEKSEITLRDVLHGASPDYAVVAQKDAPAAMFAVFGGLFDKKYGLTQDDLVAYWELSLGRQRERALDHLSTVLEKRVRALDGRLNTLQKEVRAMEADLGRRGRLAARHGRLGGPSLTAAGLLSQLIRWGMQRPALVATAHRLLGHLPWLQAAITRRVAKAMDVSDSASQWSVPDAEAHPKVQQPAGLQHLSPHGKRIYAQLKVAVSSKQQENV